MTADYSFLAPKRLLVAAAASALMGWALSLGTATHQGLAGWDRPVWRFLSEHQSSMPVDLARRITSVGVVRVLLPTAVVAGVVILIMTRSVALAAAPWVAVQITAVLVSSFKRHFGTIRPPLHDQVVPVLNPAFPSGHAADTAALVVTVAVLLSARCIESERVRRAVLGVALALSVMMAATRLVLNVHWLSDVIGGLCLGFSISLTACAVALGVSTPRQ